MSTWICICGRAATTTITKCRNCGKSQSYARERRQDAEAAISAMPLEVQKRKHKNENNRKLTKVASPEEGSFITSTIKRRDET